MLFSCFYYGSRPVNSLKMVHHLLLVFLANIVFVGCIDTDQIKTFDNSTIQHNSKRSETLKTNYEIPYYGEILYSMYDGKEIVIEGWAPMISKRFIIQLCKRADCTLDIPMQMSARLNKGKVYLSYKLNSVQGPETTVSTSAFTTRPDFEILFKIYNGIKIYINGAYLTDFGAGRVNKESLKYVSIRGEVFVNWILYSIKNPAKTLPIHRQEAGEKFIIHGTPTARTRFTCDLQCKNGNIMNEALHFDSRLSFAYDDTVMLTEKFNGDYRNTIHYSQNFPFTRNVPFVMTWELHPPKLEVTVHTNDNKEQKYTKFNLDSCYNTLYVWNDVTVPLILMT